MIILVYVYRSWATAQPVRRPERTFPVHTPGALKPLSVPPRAHLEMRWHLDASGRLTCTWQLVSDAVPARSNDEGAKPPPWLWMLVRTHQTYAKRQ